jgi:hypothetical protein
MAFGVAEMSAKERSTSLDNFYQQLRDVESLNYRLSKQKTAILQSEWAQAPGSDPQFEEAIRKEQLENLSSIRSIADDLQSAIRNNINVLSRPTLRPLRILDLPDEILMKISECAEDWKPHRRSLWIKAKGIKEVKNLRLTCRRFCTASSHLLIHYLCVHLNSSSLSQFEEISRHPAIRVGIRTVKVVLHFYGSLFADEILAFAHYHVEKMWERVESMELILSADIPLSPMNRQEVLGKIKQAKRMVRVWESYFQRIPDDSFNRKSLRIRRLLRKAQREYRRRFADQEELRQSGSFIQSVATAIARMPNVRRL